MKTIGIIICLLAIAGMKSVCQTFIENEKVLELITLKDKALFNLKEKDLTDIEFHLLDVVDSGIAINTPEKITWGNNEVFPLLLFSRSTGKHEWEFPLVEHSYLVGTNLFDGEVFVEKLFVNDREREPVSETYTVQDTSELPIASAYATIIDLYDISWLTLTNGQWRFLIIYHNWISNSVSITFEGDDTNYEIIPQSIIPPVSKDKSIPNYSQNNHTPPLPDNGLNFNLTYDKSDLKESFTCSGSFNIDSLPYHYVFEESEKTRYNREICAIVPVTLILIPNQGDQFIQNNWCIPVYNENNSRSSKKLKGYFTIDVLDSPNNVTLLHNEYLAYMVIDGNIFGSKEIIIE